MAGAAPEADPLARIRSLLLGLVLLGTSGLLLDLITLEHTDGFAQWVPIPLLVAAILTAVASWLRPSHRTIQLHRAAMAVLLALGVVGLYLHFRGNLLFELEIEPDTRGLGLYWEALRGAVPSLAPGALIELALLGLVQTYRHPALGPGPGEEVEPQRGP